MVSPEDLLEYEDLVKMYVGLAPNLLLGNLETQQAFIGLHENPKLPVTLGSHPAVESKRLGGCLRQGMAKCYELRKYSCKRLANNKNKTNKQKQKTTTQLQTVGGSPEVHWASSNKNYESAGVYSN